MSTRVMTTGEQMRMALGYGALALKPRVRADALPENTRYRDDGCDVNPTCLTCPLPRCRYEEPGGLRALLNEYRDQQILKLRTKGVAVDDLAGRFGISRRTVFRVLGSKGREGRGAPDGPSGRMEPTPIRRALERRENCA